MQIMQHESVKKINRMAERNLDLLSFLVSALELFVQAAEVFGFFALLLLASPLIKRLPVRIRTILSVFVSVFFLISLIRLLFEDYVFVQAFKSSLLIYLVSQVTFLAIAFISHIVTFSSPSLFRAVHRLRPELCADVRIRKRCDDALKTVISSSFLKISPVILQ